MIQARQHRITIQAVLILPQIPGQDEQFLHFGYVIEGHHLADASPGSDTASLRGRTQSAAETGGDESDEPDDRW